MKPNKTLSVGVVIPTYKSAQYLPQCLPPLIDSPLKPKILIVDSSSNDGTVECAARFEVECIVIPQSQFNHGSTREMARKKLNTDIVVMMTPDAIAVDRHMLTHLVAPIQQGKASVTYARQVPRRDADILEAFARFFNYPAEGHTRSLDDRSQHGAFTYFCSNSCAAYLNSALDEIGGFPSTLFGEDTLVAAKLLKRGYKIAYVSDAKVVHSHEYTLSQEFSRHFDMGWMRKKNRSLLHDQGGDGARGYRYAKELLGTLWRQNPTMIPYGILHLGAKWSGYQLGYRVPLPRWLKKRLSSQPAYWE